MRDYLWFRFWASDALSSMGFLGASMEERGLWLTLLCMMWRNGGPLEYDPEKIARMCGADADALRTLCERSPLLTVEDGWLRSDRLEEQRSIVDSKSDQARSAARKRWGENADAHADASPDAYATDDAGTHAGAMPVSSQESVVSKEEAVVRRQESVKDIVSRSPSSADRASESIREYLGDHASVVQHLQETLSQGEASRVMLSVSARWLPGGSMFKDWDTTPEDRRPAMLATALADFPWNGVVDLQHLRGFLRRVVRGEHKASETAEGWAWTES